MKLFAMNASGHEFQLLSHPNSSEGARVQLLQKIIHLYIENLFHTVVAELMPNWVKNFANSVHGLKDAAPVGLLEDGERC